MLKKIMKRAHELARQMEGHYAARLSLALREAWKEAKEVEKTKLPALIGSEKQIKWAEEIRQVVIENKGKKKLPQRCNKTLIISAMSTTVSRRR